MLYSGFGWAPEELVTGLSKCFQAESGCAFKCGRVLKVLSKCFRAESGVCFQIVVLKCFQNVLPNVLSNVLSRIGVFL